LAGFFEEIAQVARSAQFCWARSIRCTDAIIIDVERPLQRADTGTASPSS
jgi:hypothetical protein